MTVLVYMLAVPVLLNGM